MVVGCGFLLRAAPGDGLGPIVRAAAVASRGAGGVDSRRPRAAARSCAATRDGLDCSFVAVGHGACVVLEAPDGETLLYDAGALGSPEYATQSIASYLWHRGIMRIDGIVISHADIDHYNAVPGLLERFRRRHGVCFARDVRRIRRLEQPRGHRGAARAIERAGVPIREIWSGDRLRVGPTCRSTCSIRRERGVIGSDNANSITLAVEHAGRRICCRAILESPGIEDVMAEVPYDCDILLAPHHGSRRSDPPGFAAWSTPEWVVISGGGGDDIRAGRANVLSEPARTCLRRTNWVTIDLQSLQPVSIAM